MIKLLRPGLTCVFLLFLFQISYAQTRTVTGEISDSVGNPLMGATVAVKNSKVATYTDANGRFTLHLPANATTLVISYVGMQTQETTVSESNIIALRLNATASSSLNDV